MIKSYKKVFKRNYYKFAKNQSLFAVYDDTLISENRKTLLKYVRMFNEDAVLMLGYVYDWKDL